MRSRRRHCTRKGSRCRRRGQSFFVSYVYAIFCNFESLLVKKPKKQFLLIILLPSSASCLDELTSVGDVKVAGYLIGENPIAKLTGGLLKEKNRYIKKKTWHVFLIKCKDMYKI